MHAVKAEINSILGFDIISFNFQYYELDNHFHPDENYLEKLSATSESSPVELCDPNPCQNEGTCRAINGEPSTCECSGAWRGKKRNRNFCYFILKLVLKTP